MEDFKKKAEEEKYFDGVKTQYETLRQNLTHDKGADIDKNKAEIKELLEEEIARRYYYQNARYEASFKSDEDIQEALKLFANPAQYQALLKPTAKK